MPAKILIVDDEAYIRLVISQMLEAMDDEPEVFNADNGEDALKLIQQEKPDLVYLDVMMPKVNGYDVCERVKREWQMQDVTIILLTARGQEVDKQRGAEAGADLYVTKPFDPDDLLATTEQLLAAKG